MFQTKKVGASGARLFVYKSTKRAKDSHNKEQKREKKKEKRQPSKKCKDSHEKKKMSKDSHDPLR
jgi:hypothetical protein